MYRSFNDEMKIRFGKKMYKLSFDAGMNCPNRDGTLGTGGCIFCDKGGSGDFAVKLSPENISEEILGQKIKEAISVVDKKIHNKEHGFIAYFQAYTNTYDSIERLRALYFPIINRTEIEALSIATRPDCLGEEVVDFLSQLNRIKPVWVELGLQTIHEKTAEYINRCYPLSVFEDALRRLRAEGIECIVHVILGLPGESREMMLETVRYLAEQDIQGIKLSMLHVLKDTRLAEIYNKEHFFIFSLEEYAKLIKECLEIIPNSVTVHRITGDGNKKNLIAPLWSGDKKKVMNTLKQAVGSL